MEPPSSPNPVPPDDAPALDADPLAAIRRVNREFYRAFESLDIERMKSVWLKTPGIKCVHPGWKPLFDWDPIMESWERIFENTGYMEFETEDETIFVNNDLAVVSLFEVLSTVQGGQSMQGAVNATNVYLMRDGMWKMIVHHAS